MVTASTGVTLSRIWSPIHHSVLPSCCFTRTFPVMKSHGTHSHNTDRLPGGSSVSSEYAGSDVSSAPSRHSPQRSTTKSTTSTVVGPLARRQRPQATPDW